MADKKIYSIQINGIQESVNAVEALNAQLKTLEARIKALENSSVKVNAGGSSSSNSSSASEEAAVQREINKLKAEGANLDAKIAAAQDEVYKRVDATKQLYKETIADQKAMAAQERLTADAYSNTMQGMKSQLADLKAVINTTDLGDGDSIKKMTQQANELTNKLKEMEQSYGQFGRNVGNYANGVADGLSKIKINVGDTVREFGSAREASRTLNEELKAMAINGETDTKAFKDLRQTVMELESTMKDVKSPMDDIMDAFESIAAIGTISTGFAALFGFDDSEIEKSIQKMVAFQNVLKGIETINKQIQTREGIGGWIAPFTTQIDKATAKLLAFNTALLGTGRAASVAAKGIKLASTALKGLASLGIVAVITVAIEKIMDLVESFNKLSDAEQAQKDAEEAMSKAYGEGQAKLIQYKTRLDSFNGSRKEEKKLVEELNREFGSTLGTYKSLAEWQDVLKKKGELYIQMLVKQAKAQAALNGVTAAYTKLMQVQMGIANGEYDGIWNKIFGKSGEARLAEAQREVEQMTQMLEDSQKELENFNKDNNLGNYAPQIEKNTSKTKNALEESQRTLNQLELRLMQEGLNKKLRQLDEEERQTIAKLRENGRKSAAEIQKIQRAYAALRAKEINNYLKTIEKDIRETANKISNVDIEINIKNLDNQIDELENKLEKISMNKPIINTLTSENEIKVLTSGLTQDNLTTAQIYENLFNEAELTNVGNDFYNFLMRYISSKNKEVRDKVFEVYNSTNGNELTKQKAYFDEIQKMFEEEYGNELLILRSYTSDSEQTLEQSFERRLEAQKVYDEQYRQQMIKDIQKQGELNKKKIMEEEKAAALSENSRYESAQMPLQQRKDELEETLKNFTATTEAEKEAYERLRDDLKKVDDQMEQQRQQHVDKLYQIGDEYDNKLKKNEIDTAKEISSIQGQYFDEQINNYRDIQSKINDLLSKQPTMNSWGIVNVAETKRQYKELETATESTMKKLTLEKIKLEYLWKKGLITPEAKNTITQQLNDLETIFKQLFVSIEEESQQVIPKFVQSMQVYINGVVDSFSTIMSAVWDAQDTAFDKEQEQLDKWNDELDDKLDKQQEIIEQHKSAIDSIEDELATSRGDRRQHLIDQLNAEMEAQRAAQIEEQRIQKEKERAEKKQEELELKRKKAEYKRNLTQAIVNGAMAVTMAAINKWPVPAIPMMALAASTTAAQIAIMASNKPYAKGGQLEGGVAVGARHRDGGIPVLGGRASIEGGEFITNRQTTASNIDLLEYINAKHKKLDINDFISFYSSGVKKNVISMSPRTKFADGGQIPTLNNEYQFDDRLLTAFEDYSNRPVYVSVVDINKKQNDVKNIQVLSGLIPDD